MKSPKSSSDSPSSSRIPISASKKSRPDSRTLATGPASEDDKRNLSTKGDVSPQASTQRSSGSTKRPALTEENLRLESRRRASINLQRKNGQAIEEMKMHKDSVLRGLQSLDVHLPLPFYPRITDRYGSAVMRARADWETLIDGLDREQDVDSCRLESLCSKGGETWCSPTMEDSWVDRLGIGQLERSSMPGGELVGVGSQFWGAEGAWTSGGSVCCVAASPLVD